MNNEQEIKLTQYSHGGGCGCKIAPQVLEKILHSNIQHPTSANLLVGNNTKDDAAVYDLGNGSALISTTDFFMPIVDDPFSFGKIASANAISDVYAMGGKPILAIAVLGFPVEKLPIEVAQQIIEGAKTICAEANIPLAGGHSIDSPEPIFGLAVNGLVEIDNLKQNNTAKEGDVLFLTKPLGIGILSTAQKKGKISDEDAELMLKQLSTLNKVGEALGKIKGVHAMTDVTGFGLLGHLIEMCEGSKLSATLQYSNIPILDSARAYLQQNIRPDATTRNWSSYGSKVAFGAGVNVMEAFNVLPDPQTNGGLLIAVAKHSVNEVLTLLKTYDIPTVNSIGRLHSPGDKVITIEN